MHHIVLWKWAERRKIDRLQYTGLHVDVMAAMVKRNLTLPHRIICITDDPLDIHDVEAFPLWDDAAHMSNMSGRDLPSCYRRLKLYDPATQRDLGIRPGDRIVSLDLDTVVTGDLNGLLSREGRFVGWELPGTYHPRVLNGSFQMFDAGTLAGIWKNFDPVTSPTRAHVAGYMGSDQAWLSLHLAPHLDHDVHGLLWPQVASYSLQTRTMGLPGATRLVFFHGSEKPWSPAVVSANPWIKKHWRLER